MASCDAANNGSVVGAGASVTHALHEAGIGMVVAGQFPLSFEGSVRLVEVLYDELLWGTDPRQLVYDLRRRLYSQFPTRHDWASLTAYLSLPRDFDKNSQTIKLQQTLHGINVALSQADEATRRTSNRMQSKLRSEQKQDNVGQLLEDARLRMRDGKKRLRDLLATFPEQETRIYGLLASTEKRQAQVLYLVNLVAEPKKLLVNARDHYWEAFQTNRSLHWAVVQYLSLSLIVAHIPGLMEGERPQSRPEKSPKQLWSLARLLSLYDLNHESRESRSWAHGNLIELYLLSLLPDLNGLLAPNEAMRLAIEHTDQLLDIAGWNSFEAYSTRRQMLRYLEWYNELAGAYLVPLSRSRRTDI